MKAPPVTPTMPPPLPGTKKPFAFQAAQASLLAPLVAIVLNVILRVGMGNQALPIAGRIIGYVAMLLILAGFVMGIVALFGVQRHGKKGILGRAIMGVCINGIGLALFVIAIIGAMRRNVL